MILTQVQFQQVFKSFNLCRNCSFQTLLRQITFDDVVTVVALNAFPLTDVRLTHPFAVDEGAWLKMPQIMGVIYGF